MRANLILHCGIIGAMICGTAHAVSDATLIRQLVNEKNQKLARLEQCTKKMTGFKVAGISTLGLTAVGVVGDIALVNKNKEMDGQIAFAKNELARQQEKLNKAQTETADLHKTTEERKAECETHSDVAKWNGKKCVCMDEKLVYDSYDGCRSTRDRIQDIDAKCDELVAPLVNKIQTEADSIYRQISTNPKSICTMCDPECLVLQNTGYLDIWKDSCTNADGNWDYLGNDFVPSTSALYEAINAELPEFTKEYKLTATEQNLLRQKFTNCIQSKIRYFKVSCKCE